MLTQRTYDGQLTIAEVLARDKVQAEKYLYTAFLSYQMGDKLRELLKLKTHTLILETAMGPTDDEVFPYVAELQSKPAGTVKVRRHLRVDPMAHPESAKEAQKSAVIVSSPKKIKAPPPWSRRK